MAKEWRFSQCFGETAPVEQTETADILSAVEFDPSGKYLATGDKGGRIVIFESDGKGGPVSAPPQPSPPPEKTAGEEKKSRRKSTIAEYRFFCEFQSHEPSFDSLRSLEIEERVNQIKWVPPVGGSLFLLSTNDKTIILWKIHNKEVKEVQRLNLKPETFATAEAAGSQAAELSHMGAHSLGVLATKSKTGHSAAFKAATSVGYVPLKSAKDLIVPRLNLQKTVISCQPRRTFENAHAYHINSISVNSDGETFVSADDLRVNLWNLAISSQAFTVVDIKPDNMEDLTEVITACEFHPSQCSTFVYSNSRGAIKLGDMRRSALCDVHAKVFEEEEQPGDKSFFSEIIASISDVKFTRDGRYLVARDYLTLKIWDVKMETRPVKTIQIHEHLRPKLCDLYENDCIFDKFECVMSPDGKNFATGSYHNYLHIYDRTGRDDLVIEATQGPNGRKAISPSTANTNGNNKGRTIITDVNQLDFSRKVMNLAWHPEQPTIAVAALNNLYIYHQSAPSSSSSSSKDKV